MNATIVYEDNAPDDGLTARVIGLPNGGFQAVLFDDDAGLEVGSRAAPTLERATALAQSFLSGVPT